MSAMTLFLILLGLLFVFMLWGEWIGISLGVVGLIGLYIVGDGTKYFAAISSILWNNCTTFTYTAIPLFILMGELMIYSNLSAKFYASARLWLERMPGGLIQTNIFSCGVFAAISGSSPATAAAIGSVAYPEMTKAGYNKSMTIGSLAGGGALGILIPPSITMIIYGAITETSVDKLFIAGVMPGVLAVIIFMLFIGISNLIRPNKFPPKSARVPLLTKIKGSLGLLPFLSIIIAVLGGIYGGFTTPTEAAAIGVAMAIIFSLFTRTFTLKNFWLAVKAAIKLTAMIMVIVIGAQLFSYFLVSSGVSREITSWISIRNLNPYMFLLIIAVLYIAMGCLMDAASMLYLTIPVLMPIITGLGFDLIWFGVILIILIEVGMLTPPVGLNVFVLHGIANTPETPTSFEEVCKGSLPYVFLYLLVALIIVIFPAIATWLPGLMG